MRRELCSAALVLGMTHVAAASPRGAGPAKGETPDQPERAYQLSWGIDLPVVTIGAVMLAARSFRTRQSGPSAYCLSAPGGCDKNDLLFIDRPFAGRYDTTWSTFSDYAAVGVGVAPALLLGLDGGPLDGLNDAVVIYESGLLASALSSLSTLSTERPRPFVYGNRAPKAVRYGADGALSYFSGHTSFAFAMALSTFWTLRRRHPHSSYPWFALGGGLTLATTIGTARVLAGKHFPTDVFAGALVGASVGTLVPFLHSAPVAVGGSVGAHAASVDAYGCF